MKYSRNMFLAFLLLIFAISGDALAETVLTLVNVDEGLQDARMNQAIEILQNDHPDVVVEFAELEYDQVNAVLMAGEGEIDILEISTAGQESIIEAGALLDLSQDASIVEALKEWYDVEELMTYDGVLYGVPCLFWTSVLSESEPLYDFVRDVPVEVLDTWQVFLQTALEFQGDIDADGETEIWFLGESLRTPEWLNQYIAQYDRTEEIRFDEPEFREMAELYREAVQRGKVVDLMTGVGENEVLFQTYTINSPVEMQSNYHPLPALGETRINVTLPKGLSVYVRSDNADIAVELLKHYISGDVQMRNNRYYTKSARLTPEYENMAQSKKLQVDRGIALFADMRISHLSDDFRQYVTNDLLLQYWSGKMTTDELVEQLQSRLTMMLWG